MEIRFLGEDDGISPTRFRKYLEKLRQRNDAYAVQEVFVYEHISEFFDLLEKRYLDKILEDIHYVLDKGWALEISEDDFDHGHICGKADMVIKDVNALLSASNVCFLYHTFEHRQYHPEAINRNILSFPQSPLTVVHPKYRFSTRLYYTVHSDDLGFMEYARIFFQRSQGAAYKLGDGTRLTLWGKFP